MNIFYLDECPRLAARYHCDKHVVKMLLETAQLLCSVFPQGDAPYRRTHYNHPSSVWVRSSSEAYAWAVALGKALSSEYTQRYGKVHKSAAVIEWCEGNAPALPSDPFTAPPQCMPDRYMHANTVEAYRAYYIGDKERFAVWAHGDAPCWWTASG